MEIFGRQVFGGIRFEAEQENRNRGLNIDPNTVALIVSGTTLLIEIVKAAVEIFLAWRKRQSSTGQNPTVQVTLHLTMGGTKMAEVNDTNRMSEVFPDLPDDVSLIRRIELR